MPKCVWTLEEERILHKYYNQKNGIETIANLLGKRKSQILEKGRRLGYRKINFSTKNESFFEIPNKVNCYVSGFLAGDGWAYKSKKWSSLIVGISLAQKDYDHLLKIKNLLNYTGKIYHIKRNNQKIINNYGKEYYVDSESCSIHISNSHKWINDISRNWNFWTNIENLSKGPLLPPISLSNDILKLSYIAGIFDADGSVCFINEPNHIFGKSLKLGIGGGKEICDWIRDTFNIILSGANRRTVSEDKIGNIHRYGISGTNAYWISKIILSLDLPLLDRKWNNAKIFIDMIENQPISDSMIKKLNQSFSSYIKEYFIKNNIKIPCFIK